MEAFIFLLVVFLFHTIVQCVKDGGPHAPGVMWDWWLRDIGVVQSRRW